MLKTTVYVPEKLKRRLRRLAAQRKTSEATLIREAIERLVTEEAPRPTLPLFNSGDGTLAARVDELLAAGLGRDGLER